MVEWGNGGGVGEGISSVVVARYGSWSVCDGLESHAVVALAEESEMCCSRVSKGCDRL